MQSIRRFLFAGYRAAFDQLRTTPLARIEFLERIHHGIVRRLRPASVLVDGLHMTLDAGDACRLSYAFASTHAAETAFLRDRTQPGYRVLDLGANIGFYTCVLAKAAGPNGEVFAFEPSPEQLSLLRRNVEQNQLKNVRIHPVAVTDAAGTVRLFRSKLHAAANRTHASPQCSDSIEIPAIRLDDMFADDPRPFDLIKIDIEGGELAALRGMRELVQRLSYLGIFTEYFPSL